MVNPSINGASISRFSPDAKTAKTLYPDTDYTWQIFVNVNNGVSNSDAEPSHCAGSIINHLTTITVPVPASFVLNRQASEDWINNGGNTNHKITVTQAGKGQNVIITIPALAEAPYPEQGTSSIRFIGHFDTAQPAETTVVSADSDISISENVGNGKVLTADAGKFSESLQGTNE